MYWLLLLGLLALAGSVLRVGIVRRSRGWQVVGVAGIASAFAFFALLSFLSELYWFEAAGYGARFWRMLAAKLLATSLGAAAGCGGGGLLLGRRAAAPRWLWRGALLLGGSAGAFVGFRSWAEGLLFVNRVSTGVSEPILGLDSGFYLFTLPLMDRVFGLLVLAALVAFATSVMSLFVTPLAGREGVVKLPSVTSSLLTPAGPWPRALLRSTAGIAALAACGMLLARYHLLYSEWGVVAGPGWTDVHVRLPG